MQFKLLLLFFTFSCFGILSSHAATEVQKGKFTISGFVKDKSNGESLPGATIYIKELKKGTVSNNYGFYSISLPEGDYHLRYSYIGYKITNLAFHLKSDTTISIEMSAISENLSEVEIKS